MQLSFGGKFLYETKHIVCSKVEIRIKFLGMPVMRSKQVMSLYLLSSPSDLRDVVSKSDVHVISDLFAYNKQVLRLKPPPLDYVPI